MNVVLFHMGLYNEKNYSDLPLLKKCNDRIIHEFSGDTFYIFHSLKEIYATFEGFQEEYEKYQKFLENAYFNLTVTNDLVRMLLSHYLNDYVYIDSDIYIHPGFKNYLLSKIKDDTKLVMFQYGSTSIMYCKERFNELDNFIDQIFNDDNYSYDCVMNNKYDLTEIPGVEPTIIGREMEAHFYGLFTIRDYVKRFLIISGEENDNEEKALEYLDKYDEQTAIATNTWVAFKDDKNSRKTHHIPRCSNITLDDIIKTCDNFGKKTYIKEYI